MLSQLQVAYLRPCVKSSNADDFARLAAAAESAWAAEAASATARVELEAEAADARLWKADRGMRNGDHSDEDFQRLAAAAETSWAAEASSLKARVALEAEAAALGKEAEAARASERQGLSLSFFF